ncbi:MAG TPA: TasA family protein [Nocardioidaceae bacterium]|nr:TasA family protein [Nocardioidaceae bacterium]
MTSTTTSRRKVLVPLATMLAAGAIAVGSGASFTSESGNSSSAVTSGTLKQSNSKANAAIFTIPNMKPGDTVNSTLTLTNTGTLPATFSLKETVSANEFAGANLSLRITNTTTGEVVYDGTFGGLADGEEQDLGEWAATEANTFEFKVHLATTTPNTDQGKTASASYTWHSVQLDGQTFDQ